VFGEGFSVIEDGFESGEFRFDSAVDECGK
jgi:hypothetical protein